jgi:hypothetical protein
LLGRYVCRDEEETLAELLDGEAVGADALADVVGPLIAEVSRRACEPCVTVFGELVALLMAKGKPEEAIRLQ